MKKAIQINSYGKKYGIFLYDGIFLRGYCNFVHFKDFYPNHVEILTLEEARAKYNDILKRAPKFKGRIFIRRISGKYISNFLSKNGNKYRVLWKERQKTLAETKDLTTKQLREKNINGLEREYLIYNVTFKEETLTGYITI